MAGLHGVGTRILLLCGLLVGTGLAQDRPAFISPPPSPASAPAAGAIGAAVAVEVRQLSAEDFPQRQAALHQLEQLVADQVRQRAAIQEVLDDLRVDLAQQHQALGMVSDEEAQGRVAGLLEMERGLAGWTIQTMSEAPERRAALLKWGLGKEISPVVARLYAENKHTRVAAIKDLAGLNGAGADWTLARLINDDDAAVRAAAMAVAWNRPTSGEVVTALWYRAVSGPQHFAEQHGGGGGGPDMEPAMIRIEFPGGEPLEFSQDDDQGQFTDSQLAGTVLIHLNSPLVMERIKALLAERLKAGKTLCLSEDPDWTLVTHRLVEAYKIKEAVALLAEEALGTETEQMGGDMNGRPFIWSRRTMAIGVLCTLLGQETVPFNLLRARDSGESRDWIWATDADPTGQMQDVDGVVVRPFYTWWKAHHAEYGVKEEPSAAGVPPEPRQGAGRGRGRRGGVPIAPPAAPGGGEGTGGAGSQPASQPGLEPGGPDGGPAVNSMPGLGRGG